MATNLELARRRFTIDEFDRMATAGILGPDERVELIEGEVVAMSPIGHRHGFVVGKLVELLVAGMARRAFVWVQSSIDLPPRSKPQPDVALLRRRSYVDRGPTVDEVLLVIEVCETSREHDRRVKLPLYGQAGIVEAWIVDVGNRCLDVHRSPFAGGYRERRRIVGEGTVSPLAFPDVVISLPDVFA